MPNPARPAALPNRAPPAPYDREPLPPPWAAGDPFAEYLDHSLRHRDAGASALEPGHRAGARHQRAAAHAKMERLRRVRRPPPRRARKGTPFRLIISTARTPRG